MDKEEKINEILLKVAKGCKIAEVTEEYAEVDGELKLLKCKKTKKEIPPDLKALQLLLGGENGDVQRMTDEELEKEKARLLKKLAEKEKKAVVKMPKTKKAKGDKK